MANYSILHAKTLRKIKSLGAPVSFSSTGEGEVYNPATDEWSGGVDSAISGFAIEILGDPVEYSELELVPANPVTLMFAPVTYGATPTLGTVLVWAGKARTVRAIYPIRPAGVLVAARVVLA